MERSSSILTPSDLPQPGVTSAYMDNAKRIWLWEPDPPSSTGKWRVPGGILTKPGSPVLAASLVKLKVTKLRRMAPVRNTVA